MKGWEEGEMRGKINYMYDTIIKLRDSGQQRD